MYSKIIVLLLTVLLTCTSAYAADFSAEALVESTEVYAGESFAFQIRVSGTDDLSEPDLTHLKDFNVQYRGGSQNSSSSITIINGRMTKNEKKGYVFSYILTPLKTGRLTIPSIQVKSGSDTAWTSPVAINTKKPVETDDFKLRLTLSKESCYIGEPVILTVTWYIGKDVRDFNLNLPVLEDDRFNFADLAVDNSSGNKLFRVPVGGAEIIGEMNKGSLDGTQYTTITFKKVLFPEEPGSIKIDQAVLSCSALSGYKKSSNSFFDDDFFGSSRRATYQKVVIPSNSLTLKVKELPQEGRPSNFSGNIGEYKIETSASPLEVNVGDPITLTVTLSGPDYLEPVELPPLNSQPVFKKAFKVPDERAVGEINGKKKTFTQTIRPLSPDIKEIPAVKLPYFDTEKGEYRTAESKPIPLTVNKTKVVTLLDAEGNANVPVTGNDIETWGKGIVFNYEDLSVLDKEYLTPLSCFKDGLWALYTVMPPVIFIILLITVTINRKRNNDPLKVMSRKAFVKLKKSLKDTESSSPDKACEMVLDIFREYLGVKLRMPSGGAITFADARLKLDELGIEKEIIEKLKEMFESCEAGRYAGSITFKDNSTLINRALAVASELEKRLK